MARVLPDLGVQFGELVPVPVAHAAAVALELGPDPRVAEVAAALQILDEVTES